MSVIDDYLRHLEEKKKAELLRIRKIAKEVVPDAEEAITYGMPTLKYKGHSFLAFYAYKNHIGIYPFGSHTIEALKDKLEKYGLSKGAIRVPLDDPIPKNLLKQIVKFRTDLINDKG